MSKIFIKNTVNPEVQKICEDSNLSFESPVGRGQAFQWWFAALLSRHDQNVDAGEIEDNMLLSKDLGVDFILNDPDREHCYVVQTKHRAIGKSADLNEISGFFGLRKALLEDGWIESTNASNAAKELLSEYRERMKEGWKATWEFATTAQVDESVHRFAQSESEYAEECKVYDSSGLKKMYDEANSQEQSIPDEVTFDVSKGQSVLFHKPRKTLIAVVKGNTLGNIYSQHKESILAYNIRQFLGEKGINKKIMETARDKGENFFYFNNGISAICNEFKFVDGKVTAEKFQIINGGQTIGSLYKAKNNDDVLVLLRLTEGVGVATDKGFNYEVIRCNNTQNAIKDSDFRSNDAIQNDIRKKFSKLKPAGVLKNGIDYRSKRWDGKRSPAGKESVKLEELAKIRFAYKENPVISVEAPKTLWDLEKNYTKAFGEPGGNWTQEDFDESVLAFVLYRATENRIKSLKKRAKEKGKDSSNFVHLTRLRYHILGLARIFVEHHEIPVHIWKRESDFGKRFDEFWRSQIFYTTQLKHEGEKAKDVKRFYNIVRNNERWERLRSEYGEALETSNGDFD